MHDAQLLSSSVTHLVVGRILVERHLGQLVADLQCAAISLSPGPTASKRQGHRLMYAGPDVLIAGASVEADHLYVEKVSMPVAITSHAH